MLDSTFGAIGATNRFRDPIYGYIWLTDDELRIVDTPIFQRLRRIHQLALTKYIYPAAEHSRFVHSLGVLQSAENIFAEVMRKPGNCEIILGIIGDEERLRLYRKILRFTALLHDIGHLPFSHAGEEVFLPRGLRHEDVSQYIIRDTPTLKKIMDDNDVQPEIVSSILASKQKAKYSIIHKILSGHFDADRADYLLRDSHNCGVAYGHYDYIRYVSSFSLAKLDGKDFSLTIEEGNIQALEAFLLARFNYNMQVPYHRTRVGYDLALKKYLMNLERDGKLPDLGITKDDSKALVGMDIEKFTAFDDMDILQLAKRDSSNGDIWAKIIMREDHLIPVYDRVGTSDEDKINYRDYVVLLGKAGLVEGEDFFRYSKELKIHDLIPASKEKTETEDRIRVVTKEGQDVGDFLECSPVINTLRENSIRIFRVYVTSQKKETALCVKKELDRRIN